MECEATYPWYSVVEGPDLAQGDLLLDCPVFEFPEEALTAEDVLIRLGQRHVIVMTQSCDLSVRADNRTNASHVTLCAVYFKPELSDHPTYGRPPAWEETRRGKRVRYHVLNRCSALEQARDFALVDLGQIYSLPIEVARSHAARLGHRVRLLPPYREHLSQAFARFFMRVGLPVDVPEFR